MVQARLAESEALVAEAEAAAAAAAGGAEAAAGVDIAALLEILQRTPVGLVFGAYINVWAHAIELPGKALGVTSIVNAMYDPAFNPLAWVGEYFEGRMKALDAGYVRISNEPKEDVFHALVPWAYDFLWKAFIWTWEPIFSFITFHVSMLSDIAGAVSPFAIMKLGYKEVWGIEATCPDVQARLGPKMAKLGTLLPAWIVVLLLFIVRLLALVGATIVIALVWFWDLIYGIVIAIRDWLWINLIWPIINLFIQIQIWWWLNITLPILQFFIWIYNAIMFLLSIPMYVIELMLRFFFLIQWFILKIVLDIVIPIIQFMYWLVTLIPTLLLWYVFIPVQWFFHFYLIMPLWGVAYWIAEILCFIPQWIWLNIILPILQFLWSIIWAIMWFFLQIQLWIMWFIAQIYLWIWLNLIWPIIWFFSIYLPSLIWYYFRLIMQLILIPLDQICFWFYNAIEGILDAIIAALPPPEWNPGLDALGFMVGPDLLIWAANELA